MDVPALLQQLADGKGWDDLRTGLELEGLPLRFSGWVEDTPPNQAEMDLIQLILENPEAWLASGDSVLSRQIEIQEIRKSDGVHFHDPHIWINRDQIRDEGRDRWSIVIGVDMNEDFGMHLEFDGLEAIEMWCGG